jgi:nitrogen fixation protein NifQ
MQARLQLPVEPNVMATAPSENFLDPASAPLLPPARPGAQESRRGRSGAAIYRMLTGCDPADATLEDDGGFDKHVFASILAIAATEGGTVVERAGLAACDLAALTTQWFPDAHLSIAALPSQDGPSEDDEVAMVRDLLLAHCSTEGEAGRWLAAMIARRAIEPNHLWEDLGLRDRSELTHLLTRHFAPIAARNTNNMRWKRFFYRALCEAEGLVMCKSPVCTCCSDFSLCFGDETGESRLAYSYSAPALNAASLSEPDSVPPPALDGFGYG